MQVFSTHYDSNEHMKTGMVGTGTVFSQNYAEFSATLEL
jgi:hypothetical protein